MKNILQGIGIVFTLITSFLGLLYYLKGDVLVSGLVSSVIVVILYFLIQQFLKNKSEIRKNRFSVLSVILWTIYVVLSIPISFFLIHSLNVEINAKNEIKKIAESKIKSLSEINTYYETKTNEYLSRLKVDLNTYLILYTTTPLNSIQKNDAEKHLKNSPFNISEKTLKTITSINYINQANNLITAKELLFFGVLDTLKIENKNFIAKYNSTFINWSRLKLNFAFYELDNIRFKNLNALKTAYEKNTNTKNDFTYNYSKEQGLMDNPLELWKKHSPYYLIIVVLLFNLLLLLPYFLEPVSGVYMKKTDLKNNMKGGIEI